jgi:hypothetical protein
LKWIINKEVEKLSKGIIWLRNGFGVALYEHCNEQLVSIKCEELLEQLSDYSILKKNPSPRN